MCVIGCVALVGKKRENDEDSNPLVLTKNFSEHHACVADHQHVFDSLAFGMPDLFSCVHVYPKKNQEAKAHSISFNSASETLSWHGESARKANERINQQTN